MVTRFPGELKILGEYGRRGWDDATNHDKKQPRRGGDMIAQHAAEGGVLGKLGTRSESRGDGTAFTGIPKSARYINKERIGTAEQLAEKNCCERFVSVHDFTAC